MSKQLYILDTNVFIQSYAKIYSQDIFPGFWDWLQFELNAQHFIIIDKVKEEMINSTLLGKWIRDQKFKIMPTDKESEVESLKQIITTAEQMNISGSCYTDSAIDEFTQNADSHIIAYAHVHQGVVVTEEVEENTTKRIKIPTICREMNIEWINLQKLLIKFHPVFHWNKDKYLLPP